MGSSSSSENQSCLVIVESPTKARTIRKFLPRNFSVEASMGHVRDLPQSAADIPLKVKKEPWARLGVNVEADFDPLYIVPKDKSKIITALKEKLKNADALFLATDEDREGESISWHLLQLLKPKVPVKRMVFHEITRPAIEKAINNCRPLDDRLVRAQETRRILDRLVGFTLSPILWKKVAYGLSAGRVQSVALRLIIQRERERMAFKRSIYWDLLADLEGKVPPTFKAKLISVNDKKVAQGKDFDETTGSLLKDSQAFVLNEKDALALSERLKKAQSWKVEAVEERAFNSKPPIPFITSTLQQEGNRKLGLSTRETMRTAQSLYEQGFITYMRTDSPTLSKEATEGARAQIEKLFGKNFLSPEPRQFEAKQKGAQEAHEAIRPAGGSFVHPAEAGLSGAELSLYTLIWQRTLASQMAEAKKNQVTIKIKAEDTLFHASGTTIVFPGYLRVYGEQGDKDADVLLPPLKSGDTLQLKSLEPQNHETKPPARFSEASLVQAMEKAGIGRPSTYSAVISTLLDRGYVFRSASALVPHFTGFAVIQLLEKHFDHLVDLDFTSKMEESLDEIAEGHLDHLQYLRDFFLGGKGLQKLSEKKEKEIDAQESRSVKLPQLGTEVEVRIGRYGPYLVKSDEDDKQDSAVYASIPEDIAPADLDLEGSIKILKAKSEGPKPLGLYPSTQQNIYMLYGRYGAYLQVGLVDPEAPKNAPKPRRASVPQGVDPKAVTLEQALKWLSMPRDLGIHPENGLPVTVAIGRFGPFVKCGEELRSLKKGDDPYTITLEHAVERLKEEKKMRGKKLLRDLGEHPEEKKKVQIFDGKFGAYISCGKVNVTVPKETSVEAITLEQALVLLETKKKTSGSKRKK